MSPRMQRLDETQASHRRPAHCSQRKNGVALVAIEKHAQSAQNVLLQHEHVSARGDVHSGESQRW